MAFDVMPAADAPVANDEIFLRPVANPDADWVSSNPDRMLALLFVAPRDCDAIDALYA